MLFYMTSQVQEKNEIVMTDLNNYESLYKVDLNFDADISKMSPEIMTDYIVRVLANHPYYINVNNIVDVLVNEGSNTVTVVVSTRNVQEKIVNLTNNTAIINSVNEKNNVISEETQEKINLVSANLNNKKFILETTNNSGEPRMYEYEFSEFGKAKNLFIEKSVKLNGNKYRHFLRNENDNPYFYDEYMNSEIVYSPDNKINLLERKINQIEKNVYGNDFSPNNVNSVKTMFEHSIENAAEIPKPTYNVINNNINNINECMPINNINNILPINNMTMQVNNSIPNSNSINLNNLTLPINNINVNNLNNINHNQLNNVNNGNANQLNNVNNVNNVNNGNGNQLNNANGNANQLNNVNNGNANQLNNGNNGNANQLNNANGNGNQLNNVNNGNGNQLNNANGNGNQLNNGNLLNINIEGNIVEEEDSEEIEEIEEIEESENKYEINDELTTELNKAINEDDGKKSLGISKYIIVFLVSILLIILFVLIFELISNKNKFFNKSTGNNSNILANNKN